MRVGIVGAGSIGLSAVADLTRRGHEVVGVLESDVATIDALADAGEVRLTGHLGEDSVPLPPLSSDAGVLAGSDIVLVANTADRHHEAAAGLAVVIGDSVPVVLATGYAAGASFFADEMRADAPALSPRVLAMNTSPYLSYADRTGHAHVTLVKTWNEVSASSDDVLDRDFPLVRRLYDVCVPSGHELASSLNNPNPVANASSWLLNAGFATREMRGETEPNGAFHLLDFGSGALDALRDGLDAERLQVMAAAGLGEFALDRKQFPARAYGPGCREAAAPRFGPTYQTRFVSEDVSAGMVPVEAIGGSLGIRTPLLSGFIALAGAIAGEDLRAAPAIRRRTATAVRLAHTIQETR